MEQKQAEAAGILAMEIYIPSRCVRQEELELHDGVSQGKYTIGLGQRRMAFCGDREDTASLLLTVTQQLMERHAVDWASIGRIDVGSETLTDKSKALKTYLMQLFAAHDNTSIEGVDSMSGCYGGTAALFNAINWLESRSWDGRLALVCTADIAVYEQRNARPTGGAGAVCLLLGPQAAFRMRPRLRATYMNHTVDFYKPNLAVEWPMVNGQLSLQCYLRALETCYRGFKARWRLEQEQRQAQQAAVGQQQQGPAAAELDFSAQQPGVYFCFHAPYGRLVRKAHALLLEVDAGRGAWGQDKVAERAAVERAATAFERSVLPGMLLSAELGNIYCGSCYAALMSLTSEAAKLLQPGDLVVLFSYGSGCSSSMFALEWQGQPGLAERWQAAWQLRPRLAAREAVAPAAFEGVLAARTQHYNRAAWEGRDALTALPARAYYLERVDERYVRFHRRKDE